MKKKAYNGPFVATDLRIIVANERCSVACTGGGKIHKSNIMSTFRPLSLQWGAWHLLHRLHVIHKSANVQHE